MKKIITYLILFFIFVTTGCGSGTEASNPPSPTTTKLLSSSLFEEAALKALFIKQASSSDCGEELEVCLTPSNVSGQVYYAGIMVGIENGYSVGPIVGNITDPSVITSFPQADLQDFDLGEQLEVDGGIVCCGGSTYPSDEEAIVQSVDIYFAYVDVTFTLEESDGVNSNLVGTHIVRTVYGDMDDTDFKKGDLLYKGASDTDFLWCTLEEGCIFTQRPENPLQNPDVTNYAGSEDGLGNQTIPTFTANLADGHETITLTELNVLNNSLAITIDFDMTNGVGFSEDITTFSQISELVEAFRLAANPGDENNGFSSTVEIELTPL